jgi:hypothetical protein
MMIVAKAIVRTKPVSAEAVQARSHALLPILYPGHDDTINIETDGLAPEEVAQQIDSEL